MKEWELPTLPDGSLDVDKINPLFWSLLSDMLRKDMADFKKEKLDGILQRMKEHQDEIEKGKK